MSHSRPLPRDANLRQFRNQAKDQSCSAQRLQWRRWAAGLSCNAHGGWQQVRSARAGRATGWVGSAQHQAPRITGTSDRGARLDESGGGVVLLELLDVRQ
jgi:hypothetical protein